MTKRVIIEKRNRREMEKGGKKERGQRRNEGACEEDTATRESKSQKVP